MMVWKTWTSPCVWSGSRLMWLLAVWLHNHEHCAVALGLYEELTQGHTVVGEANASQHSIQLVTPSDMPTPDSSPWNRYCDIATLLTAICLQVCEEESYKAAVVNMCQRGPAGRGLQDMVEWVRDSFIGIHASTGGERIRRARSPWEKESVWQVNVERSRKINVMSRELSIRHRQRRSRVLWS